MKFRCCIELLQNNGELKEVTAPVSAQLEMAAIVKRQLTKSSSSPALLFRSIEECSFSCMANLFGTTDRISMILSGNDGDSLDQRMAQLDDGLDSFSSFMSWLSAADECKPKRVCPPDMIQLDDFSDLPAIKVWPEDAGHYLSLAVVICRTRQGQRVNC
ncbi:MAG: UbiD family decarboxylase, partial [Deltaproteobacteria bacterium]|nr:UbiD family decarboxylase [Deltaproteobacteria bacterium]